MTNYYLNAGDSYSVSIANTGASWQTVYGDDGTITLTAARASIEGNGDAVTGSAGSSASFYATSGLPELYDGSNGHVTLNNALADITGASNVIYLEGAVNSAYLQGYTDMLNIFATTPAGGWDSIYGSSAFIYVHSSQTNVFGDDIVECIDDCSVGFYNSTSSHCYADDSQIDLVNSKIKLWGTGNTIFATSGSSVQITATSGWSLVTGSNVTLTLLGANVSIYGGSDSVSASPGGSISLYDTQGHDDTLSAYGDKISLNNSQAMIDGLDDTIWLNGNSSLNLIGSKGNWETIYATGDSVGITAGSVSLVGGGDHVRMGTSDIAVSVYQTAGVADTFTGAYDLLTLTSAQASISGIGTDDTIWEYAGSTLTIDGGGNGGWDSVYATGQTVDLATGANASVFGGNDTIALNGSSAASLYQTAGAADTVSGSGGFVTLTDAQASVTGSHDATFFIGANDALTVSGQYETFHFAAALGLDTITGFDASDGLHLATADWASFSALQSSGDLTQVGANTVLRLDASDAITLTGVTASTLNAANFSFSKNPYAG